MRCERQRERRRRAAARQRRVVVGRRRHFVLHPLLLLRLCLSVRMRVCMVVDCNVNRRPQMLRCAKLTCDT
jgi:hypothetical protein